MAMDLNYDRSLHDKEHVAGPFEASRESIVGFARSIGEDNPIFLDEAAARAAGFGGIIAHGMLTLAYISEMMTLAFGRSWLEGGRLKVRFKGAAYPGDTVRTWGRVVKDESDSGARLIECAIGLSNSRGEELITGVATITQSA